MEAARPENIAVVKINGNGLNGVFHSRMVASLLIHACRGLGVNVTADVKIEPFNEIDIMRWVEAVRQSGQFVEIEVIDVSQD